MENSQLLIFGEIWPKSLYYKNIKNLKKQDSRANS